MPSISSGSAAAVDLALAALLAPTSSTRNVIQGTGAGVTPLTARGFSGQTADVFVADDSSGTDFVAVDASGVLKEYKGMAHAIRTVTGSTTLTKNDHVVFAESAAASGSWNAGVTALAPVLWDKLDESGTTTITDSGSGAHNGTLSGNYTQAVAALLTGSTSALQVAQAGISHGDFHDFAATAAFSVGCWFKPDATDSTGRRLVSKEYTDGSGIQSWRLYYSTTGFRFDRCLNGSQNSITSATTPVNGTTYFVMYTYSGTQSRLYINGVLDAGPTTHSLSMPNGTANLTVGRTPTGVSVAQGTLDEVLIFDSQVAAADISNLYALGTGGGGAGPITVTLPAASAQSGQRLEIYKSDATSGSVTVSRAGSDTINGATSVTLQSQYAGVVLVSDGTSKWYVAPT